MDAFAAYMGEVSNFAAIDEATIALFYEHFFCNLTPVSNPRIIVLAGSPGSGKTTYRNEYLSGLHNYHVHDMDDVLVMLPGYKYDLRSLGKLKAFDAWMETARVVADMMMCFALSHRYNIIYDRTCGSETSFLTLRKAKLDLNYLVDLYGFFLPVEKAIKRVKDRAKTEPRIVNESVIYDYYQRVSALWPYYVEFTDSATLFDSESDVDNIKLVYSSETQKKIVDEKKYYEFLVAGKNLNIKEKFSVLNELVMVNG